MFKLNLPAFSFKLIKKNSKKFIFDIIRKKYFVLTPEEWVRIKFNTLLSIQFKIS